MKILCINHEYPPIGGGGATACAKITDEYVKAGNSVIIITAQYSDLPTEEIINGVKIIRVKCKRSKQHSSSFMEMLSFLKSAFFKTGKVLKSENFDVIHVFFGIPSGPIGYYYSKKYKIPYIVRLGGGDIPGKQKRFDIIYKFINPFLKIIWKNSSCVVANSQGLLQSAQKFYDNATYKVIPNGISKEDFNLAPSFNNDINEMFTICSTARIITRKGLKHIIEALPSLRKLTNNKINYVILGDGPQREELMKLAISLAVDDIVEITGFIDRREVLDRLPKCDVFVLPSYWEGMPNVVLEAMVSGLPVIMTNCEGSSELMDDENGFVINLDTDITQGFHDAILKLANNKDLCRHLGETGYNKVMNNFTWQKTAEKYIELIDSVCSEK